MARESKRKRDERRFGKPERLIDMIEPTAFVPPFWVKREMLSAEQWQQFGQYHLDLAEKAATAVPIEASNVSEFLYAENPKEDWPSSDFPCSAPPFETFWVEFKRPSRLVQGETITDSRLFPERWGWLFACSTREQSLKDQSSGGSTQERLDDLEKTINWLMQQGTNFDEVVARLKKEGPHAIDTLTGLDKNLALALAQYKVIQRGITCDELIPAWVKWHVQATLIIAAHGRVCAPAQCVYTVSETGEIKPDERFLTHGGHFADNSLHQGFSDSWSSLMKAAFLAVSFLNCKNVTLVGHDADLPANRERQKAGLKPFVRYHTINIEPMKQVLRTEGNVEANGLKKALHICRGHFATYSEERPLFGKHAGTFWVPAHVRGSAKQGVVVSDYNVHAPGA